MPFVTVTHSLVWHMTSDPTLSAPAREVFEKVDNSQDFIVIPCIVFFELIYLIEKKRIAVNFDTFLTLVHASNNYRIEPLCLPIIEKCEGIPREKIADPWDRIIAATSMHLDLPLITGDESLRELGLDIIW